MTEMRQFNTGATRNVDTNKYDYEAFLSPLVLEAYAAYMHKNRFQADGKIRDGDNWQKGIPKDAYMKSAFRHFMDLWKEHRGIPTEEGLEQALTALLFNIMGYLHEIKKAELVQYETAMEDLNKPAWRGEGLENFIFDPAANHFTHRYGALAHDAEAIEDEASDGEAARVAYSFLYAPGQGKDYTTSNDPAFPGVSGMEHG